MNKEIIDSFLDVEFLKNYDFISNKKIFSFLLFSPYNFIEKEFL